MRLRVKICCMASVEEAGMAAAAGEDLIGMVGPMPSGAGAIDLRTARVIADGAAPRVTPVLPSSGVTAGAMAAEIDLCTGVRTSGHLDRDKLCAFLAAAGVA